MLRLECPERSFLDWASRHRIGGVLVRPDRFIAERLASGADLRRLDAFAAAARTPAIQPANCATAA